MTVLVDGLVDYGEIARQRRLPGTWWCHMMSDAEDPAFTELHAMAQRIGLRRSWFQGDHYDLTPSRRTAALRAGAEAVDARALILRGYPRGPRMQAKLFATENGREVLLRYLGRARFLELAKKLSPESSATEKEAP